MIVKHRFTPWECSASYEQKYAEDRDYVAQLMEGWGSTNSKPFPAGAAINDVAMVPMTNSWMHQLVELGRRGIRVTVERQQLVDAVPEVEWPNQGLTDVYFIERLMGNSRVSNRMVGLSAYIPLLTRQSSVLVLHLGCGHQGAYVSRTDTMYQEYTCPRCEAKWGVDRSD